ncbi:MAG: squalene/phytoene synthase family protein [Litoreibacter sp.]|nr:squalene/phytoene synthase family protein [Litoreibacter sp.]MCY4336477.1 squalene/phytoene synthase family protein [Litoreibacter sp.]
MSLEACAALVEEADPDRFATARLADDRVQRILWPLYAFNIEVTRAPWVTQEPMIAEIRLQWWRDALEEIREGRKVRSHAVTVPLAEVLDAEGAMVLDRLVEARAWDIYSDPFPDQKSFDAYIDATYGGLFWTAARLIGDASEAMIRKFAYACGVAAILRAAPELARRGRDPLPVDDVAGYKVLTGGALNALDAAVAEKEHVQADHEALMLSGWQTRSLLRAALADSESSFKNGVTLSEFSRRFRLFKLSTLGWWR